MSMKSSSKASDTCFFSFFPCFCSTPRQQVIPGMPHGGRASPSAALSPVLAAPAEGWNGSAPWRHGWKVMKSLENMGKHGKTTMGTMKFWKHLENYSLCVCLCVRSLFLIILEATRELSVKLKHLENYRRGYR